MELPFKLWRYLLSSKRTKSVSSPSVDGGIISDPSASVDCFNQYFKSVFTFDTNNNTKISESQNSAPSLTNFSITESGVLSLLLNFDTEKSPGIDDIPKAFLQRYSQWCAEHLCIIYKKSIFTCKVPGEWKRDKITPLLRSGGSQLVMNYRPISLLCVSRKSLEHVEFKRITYFLESSK